MYQEAIALSQEIENFTAEVMNLVPAVDVQVTLTTASVDHTASSSEAKPGEAGLLIGVPISMTETTFVNEFRHNLLCKATYWERNNLPSDPAYECEQEAIQITVEYLDCLCETETWEGNAGAATAEPLEASLLAMCRAAEDPPDVCYEAITPFTEASERTNIPFLRSTSTAIFVLVGDSGDSSRRLALGTADTAIYSEAFERFEQPLQFVSLGPNYDPISETIICNSGNASGWMADRLLTLSTDSGGFFFPLEVYNNQGNCTSNYFSSFYAELLALLAPG